MRAILYAAGVGNRLSAVSEGFPKVLLRFGGRSLLERHLRILAAASVTEVVVVTGHGAEAIADEVARIDSAVPVRLVHNPEYRAGSIVTQWVAREAIGAGGTVLLMDADVLYDQGLMARLIDSAHADCFLLDRDIEAGEEPVKLCIRDDCLVDFRKRPDQPYDWAGESVGFFKIAERNAARLIDATRAYIESGRTEDYYDEALRDLLLADPPGSFGWEDITGMPWCEIDFPDDVVIAERDILPRLAPLPSGESDR